MEYKNIEDYLLFKLSKIYKYRDGDKYYKDFRDICHSKDLPPETTLNDVKKYLMHT